MPDKFQPSFSVITVTYNAEKVLSATLRSVLEQTYPHIEYIIVDGASTDGTLTLTEPFRDRIARIVSEPDRGLYDAMNKGILLATGDYLCFLNAGDTFHDAGTLEQIVRKLPANHLPDVVYGETALVDSQHRFLRMRRLSAPEQLTWKSFKAGMLVCHQAFLARRRIVGPYKTTYRFSADFDWCIRVLKDAKEVLNTHLTLIDYLDEGLTTQNQKASLKERFRIMSIHYGLLSTICHHIWFVFRMLVKK